MLRYCAKEAVVTVPDEVEKIGEYCFRYCNRIQTVDVGPLSRLTSIDEEAFFRCGFLRAIVIPASVTSLGEDCFAHCSFLETVSFCPGSKLECIPDAALALCHSLRFITIPSTVKILGNSCMRFCDHLLTSPWESDSQLVRLEDGVFWHCSELQSVFLPASVEFIADQCFLYCYACTSLTIGSPSHLREVLDLPPGLQGVVHMPDCLEILHIRPPSRDRSGGRAVVFGPESRLVEFAAKPERGWPLCRTFLQLSARTLKRCRTELEFKGES
jgi:hypothetical protein